MARAGLVKCPGQFPYMKNTSRSFRLVCDPDHIPDVEALLHDEGFAFDPEPFHPLARTLTAEPRPLGRSLAARFGYIYIQDKSSMLPPLALDPARGAVVLDMCASPGSKTGFLSQLVGPHGLVLANEPSADRLATLRVNMRHLGCFNVVTSRYEGQDLPLDDGRWPLILLDAPCSGWGTVDKNPRAARMWAGDKTLALENLQRDLLATAARLLAPGGRLLYSTCTTNRRENEDQVRYAVDSLGLSVIPLPFFAGFSFASSLPGCLLVDGADSRAQGFFLACLGKPGQAEAVAPLAESVLPGEMVTGPEFSRQTGLDNSRLPEHGFLCVGGRVYLILDQARQVLPQSLRWQGFGVGKTAGNTILPDPSARIFVPTGPDAEALVLDEPAAVHALLTGQSLPYDGQARRRGLYYRNLPLGFVTVKGRRCLWSDR